MTKESIKVMVFAVLGFTMIGLIVGIMVYANGFEAEKTPQINLKDEADKIFEGLDEYRNTAYLDPSIPKPCYLQASGNSGSVKIIPDKEEYATKPCKNQDKVTMVPTIKIQTRGLFI